MKKIKEILTNQVVNKITISVLLIIIAISLVFTGKSLYDKKTEIEKNLSEAHIANEKIREAIKEEKSKIKKEEYKKIIIPQTIIIVVDTIILIGIIIINKKETARK